MADQTIDRLIVEVESTANETSTAGIDKIATSIEKLKKAFGMGTDVSENVSGVAKSMKDLRDAMNGIGSSGTGFSKIVESIEKLKQMKMDGFEGQIRQMTDSFQSFREIIDISKPVSSFGSGIKNITNSLIQLKDMSIDQATQKCRELKDSLLEFQGLDAVSSSIYSFGSGIRNTMNGLAELGKINIHQTAEDARELTIAVQNFSGIQSVATPIKEFGSGVSQMAAGFKVLQDANIEEIKKKIEQLTAALKPFIEELSNAGGGVINFGTQMKAFSDALRSANNMQIQFAKQTRRSKSGTGGFGGLGGLFKGLRLSNTIYLIKNLASAVKSVTQKMGGYVEKTNDYIENMNLFTVSMGEFTEKANEFTTRIQTDLGFDSGEAARYMGIFQQLSTSFGVSADRAYVLSKNLTQLGYDFASFYNLKTEESFQKLQAAISGELEPIRRLGIDISAARLQQELYALGIDATVDSLTQADKETLRYIAIMKQVGNVTTDAARTIQSPANALRVLRAQMDVTARQIGSVFIPILNTLIPYLTAFVKIIGMLAAKLAAFLGFEMPTFDVPEPSGLPAVSEGMDDVAEAAKEAKKQTAYLIGGFDELNRLEAKQEAGKDALGIGNLLDNIELPEYDMFEGLVTGNVDEIVQRIIDAFKRLRDTLMDLGLREVLQNFKDFWDQLSEQIEQYDFATAIKEALLNGFELAMSLINLAQRIVFPIVIALDVPGIVYETIQTLSAAFEGLNDVIRALTPGVEEFVQRGLVPIAEWIGDKIRDALQFLQEQFQKIGDWFSDHTDMFTEFGKAMGDLTGVIWKLIEPIADPIWEGFKTILGKIVDLALKLIQNFIEMVTPIAQAAVELYKWLDSIGVIDTLMSFIKQQIDGAVLAISGIIDALGGVTTYLSGWISGDWNKQWEGLKEFFKGIWDAMWGIIQMFFGDSALAVKEWIEEKIFPWFSIEKWKEVGQNLVDGFVAGIGDIWEKVKEKFAAVVDGVKSFLGIHSPSTVFQEIGSNMIQGLFNGIDSAWQSILTLFTAKLAELKNGFSEKWTEIIQSTETAFSSIKETISSKVQEAIENSKIKLTEFHENWTEKWESAKVVLSEKMLAIKNNVSEKFSEMKASTSSFLSEFRSSWSNGMNNIKTITSSVFNSMRSTASSAFNSIQSFASSMISRVRDAIGALNDLISKQDKVKAGGSYAANLKNNPNRVQINNARPRNIPALASGGVVRKPTYALVGEYSGANTNPEVVAPKSTIRESVVEANGSMVDAMYQMAQMMISAIREGKDISIQIDGREVGKASSAYMRDEERRTGKNPGKL